MRIGLDIDDVLFPWSNLAHEACVRAGITNGKTVTQWDMSLDYGCTRDEVWDAINVAYLQGMLLHEPFPGVRESLTEARKAGHTIHLATARGFEGALALHVRIQTATWLSIHDVPHDSMTFTKSKADVRTDVFLDDSIPNVQSLLAAGVDAYLHDQCHNRHDTTLPRVASLSDFLEVVAA